MLLLIIATFILSLIDPSLAQIPSTGIVAPEDFPPKNFTQRLFHDSNATDTSTFNHAYQIDDRYFRPGGPIFFYQNPEIDTPIGVNASGRLNGLIVFPEYNAEEVGALRVCLEHRFFGTSYPEGLKRERPNDFAALTLDNIIQDAVEFVKFVKSTVPGAEQSPVIVTGGSYGGFLAMMMKIREPEVFHGSIAMSPSFRALGPFDNSTEKFAGWNQISNMYYDVSFEGAERIKSAMRTFRSCTKEGDCTSMPGLQFCGLQPNSTELAIVYEAMLTIFQFSAQFDYPFSTATFPTAYPIQSILNKTLAAQTPGAVVQAAFDSYLYGNSTSCIDWQNPKLANAFDFVLVNTWNVIICSIIPLSDLSRIPEDNMLPAQYTTGPVYCPLPEEWWGPDYNHSAAWFDEHYGTRTEDLNRVERLLLVNGQHDPGSGYSERELALSPNRNRSRVINVSLMTHSEAQFQEWGYPRGIKPTIDEARDIQMEHIKAWIGWNPESKKEGVY